VCGGEGEAYKEYIKIIWFIIKAIRKFILYIYFIYFL